MINQFLYLLLIKYTNFKITLNINIKKQYHTTQQHHTTILQFHYHQINKIKPLHHFLHILHQTKNIKTIFHHHFLNLQQHITILYQLLTQTNNNFQILTFFQTKLKINKLQFTFTYQITNTIQHYTTIITNNTPTTITI